MTAGAPEVWRGAAYPGAPSTVAEAAELGIELRAPRWGIADAVVLVLGGILVPLLLLSALLASGMAQRSGAFLLCAAVSPWIVFAGWPLVTTHLQGNGVRIDLGFVVRSSDVLWGIGGGLACFLLATPVALLTEKLFGQFESAAGEAAQEAHAGRWVLVLYALLVLVGAPLAEELAFRGLAFATVAKHVGTRGPDEQRTVTRALVWASVWSTILFAAIHLEPVRVPVLLVIGGVLAYLRARTGRVGASVIAHALNNLPGAIGIATLGLT